jgi:uncharacterized protein (DUF302 family)
VNNAIMKKVEWISTLKAMRLPIEALGYKVFAMIPVRELLKKGKLKQIKKIIIKAENLGKQMARTI